MPAEAMDKLREDMSAFQTLALSLMGGKLFERVTELINLREQMENLELSLGNLGRSSDSLDASVNTTLGQLQTGISGIIARLDKQIVADEAERRAWSELRAKESVTLGLLNEYLKRWG